MRQDNDEKLHKFLRKLEPTEFDIERYRSAHSRGEISLNEIRRRAKYDQIERVLSDEFDPMAMTLTERKLHAILQFLCFEMPRR